MLAVCILKLHTTMQLICCICKEVTDRCRPWEAAAISTHHRYGKRKENDQYWKQVPVCTQSRSDNLREKIVLFSSLDSQIAQMAFMIPVVRNDWDVWMRSGKPRPSGKSSRNNGQTTESRSDDTNLSTTPSRNGIMADTHRNKRSLAIEIRNQQHLRISGGSLPSNFQSAHVTLPLSGSSSRHRRPLNGTSRLHSMHSSYRVGKSRAFEQESVVAEDEATASLPNSFEGVSPPTKVGSQNSLQKFHTRLVDRLRRSLRLNSTSASVERDNCVGENGSRTSS
ncbi:uncharacterized protein LOC124196221 isoform X1 [Daphnia pulex]|uniref:uncharacterized protein LOC124196221 isoform X1 n=2 Tax=Daphnia pulex TaxID=6669 RepID=UPI001EE0D963|nr:uncharacterized protein LOC124196221 isoform X1 [Daphnia pulex]